MYSNQVNATPEINMLMFGAPGVGKSSMVAAMYEQLSYDSELDFTLECRDLSLRKKLVTKVENLKQAGSTLNNKGGIEGTSGKIDYVFHLSSKSSKKTKVIIRFTDIPGGWLTDESKHEELSQLMQDSRIIMLPVHAPALMDKDGEHHDKINQPFEIEDFFLKQNIQHPTMVLLAPVKCETYMHDRSDELLEKLRKKYDRLISQFKDQTNVALAITPIETMGNMRFDSWQEDSQDKYYRIGRNPYAPRFVEQPLCYALNFSLNYYLNYQRSSLTRLIDQVFPIFNLDKDIKVSIEKLAREIKTREQGFQLVQGEHLLMRDIG